MCTSYNNRVQLQQDQGVRGMMLRWLRTAQTEPSVAASAWILRLVEPNEEEQTEGIQSKGPAEQSEIPFKQAESVVVGENINMPNVRIMLLL